ncbi:hypothetical protein VB713_19315 [Anabaena cylindrica UHCC 0172]|uniref:hypothetical protein n=1 Tax=Anabaena cylindrica TaxID=1165 RepID=UPI002B1FA373|nr:hypothetical protein [Anabaena cylindrica]MEA5553098.1 hypothetical protein [Anabaena cylindrica UHCC 0172]
MVIVGMVNMNPEYEIRVKHFAVLKEKYQASNYEDSSPSSPLYFILRKADLGVEIQDLEYIWLQTEQLSKTVEFIRNEQKHRSKERIILGGDFTKLKSKYQVINSNIEWTASPLYFILCKIDSGDFLNEKESNWLISHGFNKTKSIAIETRRFFNLKSKYKANQYQDSSPDSPLFPILKKIDILERLTESEYKWLQDKQLLDTLGFVEKQEAQRRDEFIELKEKYQATKYENKSVSSPLYPILNKLAGDEKLIDTEIAWLKEQELIETIAIAEEQEKTREFAALKFKYKATKCEDLSPNCHLYKVLKIIDSGILLAEQDVNFLKKRNLLETLKISNDKYVDFLKTKIGDLDFFVDANITWLQNNGYGHIINIAYDEYADKLQSKVAALKLLKDTEIDWLKTNGYQDVIILMEAKHFDALKSKYHLSNYQNKLLNSPLYAILQKLEKAERIEPKDVAWLQENGIFYDKIWTKYHSIEADFYQQEFKRTSNKWNLANASSHLRKVDKPELALQLTNNLLLEQISDNKLKSALLTTRGGAFRDVDKLDAAETCARQAMKFQPDSHHPYTLMGAICYQQGKYLEGDNWFKEAIKRGANPRDTDSEIKSVLKKTKDEKQRHELVYYLLRKDSKRYAWAKDYLKKQKDKK